MGRAWGLAAGMQPVVPLVMHGEHLGFILLPQQQREVRTVGADTCNTQGKALQDGFAPLTLSPVLLHGSTMLPGEAQAPRHCNEGPSGSLHRQEGKNGTEIIIHVHMGRLELQEPS